MLSKIKYRADVSKKLRKDLQTSIREFMWPTTDTTNIAENEKERPLVKWEIVLLLEEEGGTGLKDPDCMLDAANIKTIKNIFTKAEQPWMKWEEGS